MYRCLPGLKMSLSPVIPTASGEVSAGVAVTDTQVADHTTLPNALT